MNFCLQPNSRDRFARRLAMREGFEFTAGRSLHCQLFDIATGSGPSTTQTTQTTSGNGRGISGNRNQYTESGAISVGQRGSYVESGGINLDGQRINVARGASLTLNQAPAPGSSAATGLNGAPHQVAVPGSTPSPTQPTLPPTGGVANDSMGGSQPQPNATNMPSTSLLATLKGYWANFSTWQKIGAGAVLVLTLWLIFHKRR